MEGFRDFAQAKLWRLNKPQILKYWQTLRTDSPILFSPIRPDQKGSTFGEDGIRLTGSQTFIDSVLGRLKDIMAWETPQTKVSVLYRQTKHKGIDIPNRTNSFVFYCQVKSRKPKNPL